MNANLLIVVVSLVVTTLVHSHPFGRRTGIFDSLFRAPLRHNFEMIDDSNELVKEWYPNTRVINTDQETTIVLEIPGISRENVKVNLKGNILTVSGETNFCKFDDSDSKKPPAQEQQKEQPNLSSQSPADLSSKAKDCRLHPLERKFSQKFTLSRVSDEMAKKFWADVTDGMLFVHIPKIDLPETEIPIVNKH